MKFYAIICNSEYLCIYSYLRTMNNVKTEFSISDLESLTGVKSHTIRIWEKRYGILSPMRSDSNLRSYTLNDLRKMLNINLLIHDGLKVSKVAKLGATEIETMVNEIRSAKVVKIPSIHLFKLAMMTFDQSLFLETSDSLLNRMPFEELFLEHYMQLLDEVGLMWQTGNIQPAHEHFISCLIRMVTINQTAVSTKRIKKDAQPDYILFLPYGEIHELGLLFLNYLISSKGKNAVYLGSNISLDNLNELTKLFKNVTYITYLTVLPAEKPLEFYVNSLLRKVKDNDSRLLIVGRRVAELSVDPNEHIKCFKTLRGIVDELKFD